MSEILEMHPARIKPRDIARIVETLRHGGVVIAPSDSGYALLCQLDDKSAAEKIRHIRELERDHPFTILCADLTDLARYARVDNVQFRLLKTLFPGAYTCILPASREVPRRVQNDKRKTIGIRVPDHFVGIVAGEAVDTATLTQIASSLRDGVTEVMLHPGTNNETLVRDCLWNHDFEAELTAVCAPAVRDALAAAGAEIVNFRIYGN